MDNKIDVHEFNAVLNDMIDENFPNTVRYIVSGGDYIKDVLLELREDDKLLRYSPYELYMKSNDYEETIDEFIERWKVILQQ